MFGGGGGGGKLSKSIPLLELFVFSFVLLETQGLVDTSDPGFEFKDGVVDPIDELGLFALEG
jgi:hypothetical protein